MNKYKFHKNQVVETRAGNSVQIVDRYKCFDKSIIYQVKYRDGHIGKQWIFECMIESLKFI